VLISNNGKPYITKDGVTVANNIKLDDPFEQLGATVVKNVAKKTCDQCGDGTSTSCVLAQAIISEGLKTIKSGSNPVLIKRGMDQALQSVKVSIKNQSREIITHEDLVNVASISANNDREIGELIGEAMAAVKNQGIITVDPSDKTDTYVEKVDGLQFDQGYLSPYFINNRGKLNVIYNNPVVLIMKDKLKNMRDVIDTLSDVATQNQEILIITPDIDSEILQMFAANAAQGSLKCCIVKAPGFGEFQR
jgi:chaperonin GroEL